MSAPAQTDIESQFHDTLSGMNPKELQKEYKSTQKDLKSKDVEQRHRAHEKLKNEAYFSDGGCAPIAFQTICPKAKSMNDCYEVLQSLESLSASWRAIAVDVHPLWKGLKVVCEEGRLSEVFRGLLDCLTFAEPVKVKKSKKASSGEPEEEKEIFVQCRTLAIKLLYNSVLPMMSVLDSGQFYQSVSQLDGLFESLLMVVQQNSSFSLENCSQYQSSMQNCAYAIQLLAYFGNTSLSFVQGLVGHTVSQQLDRLTEIPLFRLQICQWLRSASIQEQGIDWLSSEENISLCVGLLEKSQVRYLELFTSIEEPVDAKKNAKKDGKKDKIPAATAIEPPVDPFSGIDYIRLDENRQLLLQLFHLIKSLSNIAQRRPEVIGAGITRRITQSLGKLLLKEQLWTDCHRFNDCVQESLLGWVRAAVVLVGMLAETSSTNAEIAIEEGIIATLYTLLIQSGAAVGIDIQNSEGVHRSLELQSLRQCVEKSLLSVLSTTVASANASQANCRWKSSATFEISSKINDLDGHSIFLSKTVEALQSPDADLCGRAARLLLALSITAKSNNALVNVEVDMKLLQALSIACKLFANVGEEKIDDFPHHCLDITHRQGLYFVLAASECALALGAPAVQSFFDSSLVDHIVAAVNYCANIAADGLKECKVSIEDPRHFHWDLSRKERTSAEFHLLAPVAIDILTIMVASHRQYLVFESTNEEVGQWNSLPQYSSPCEVQSFQTIKIAASTIAEKLLFCTRWSNNNDFIVVNSSESANVMSDPLLQSSLKFWTAVGNSGPIAKYGALEQLYLQSTKISADSEKNQFCRLMDEMNISIETFRVPFQRFQYFSDSGITDVLTTKCLCDNPSLLPFVMLIGCIVAVLSDNTSSALSLQLSIDALGSLTRTQELRPETQYVVDDVLASVAASLGTVVNLISSIGRFGKLDNSPSISLWLQYLIYRGYCREDYWVTWERANRAQIVVDPKTGKPIPKKDDKDKKTNGKDSKKADKGSTSADKIFPEVQSNAESTEEFPDPNRGPSRSLWSVLMNSEHKCSHIYSERISALTCAIISGLGSHVAGAWLDNQQINVNNADSAGKTPLMYALVLGDTSSVDALLSRNVDVDAVDSDHCPTILYAFCSLPAADILTLLPGFLSKPLSCLGFTPALGTSACLSSLLNANVDVNVCNVDGWSPLLFAMGKSCINVFIGGYPISVTNIGFRSPSNSQHVVSDIELLLSRNCHVNHASRSGCVALHIAFWEGCVPAVRKLLDAQADPNVLDKNGWHALHFLLCNCPPTSPELFELLMAKSMQRSFTDEIILNTRTGASRDDKARSDIRSFFAERVEDSLLPFCLSKKRASLQDILCIQTVERMTPLFLCMGGDLILSAAQENRKTRILMLLHIAQYANDRNCWLSVLECHETLGINLLQAVPLLLRSEATRILLTEKQKRSRRIRYFDCDESELLDKLMMAAHKVQWFSIDVPLLAPCQLSWTCFHAIFAGQNISLFNFFVHLFEIEVIRELKLIEILARMDSRVDNSMADRVVEFFASDKYFADQLNECCDCGDFPIFVAIDSKQYGVIAALSACPKVDLSKKSICHGLTPLEKAIEVGDEGVLQSLKYGMERLHN